MMAMVWVLLSSGPVGFALLALSVVLMLLSLGASLLLAFGRVPWITLSTPRLCLDAVAAGAGERDVSADRIRTEYRSRDTLETLLQYREWFQPHTPGQPLLVTSRFHLARSSLLAAALALRTRCVPPRPDGWRRSAISCAC
jgi:uncharacterized SAM-binding protein YcdF (DUF218 family)